MTIKAVVFDCFGVLIVPARTLLYEAYPELGQQIGMLERRSDMGLIDRDEFVQSVANLTGVSADEIKNKYYDVNARSKGALDWVRQLRATGEYKIGLLSNIGHGWIEGFLEQTDSGALFDEVVLSCNVGMVKPSPEIFTLMAQNLQVPADECVMIDDLEPNIAGARKAGMNGIVFRALSQAQNEFEKIVSL
jgi:putative hydrolase of the HAD superfamily